MCLVLAVGVSAGDPFLEADALALDGRVGEHLQGLARQNVPDLGRQRDVAHLVMVALVALEGGHPVLWGLPEEAGADPEDQVLLQEGSIWMAWEA